MPPALKRPAAAAAASPKKQKLSPVLASCQVVSKGIQSASDIPPVVQHMLQDMLESSLGVYKEERHKYQEGIVEMVGNVLAGVEASLQQKIEEAEAKVAGGDDTKTSREEAVQEAEATLTKKAEEAQERKRALAEDAMAFKAAREAVYQAQAGQKKCEEELAAVSAQKAALEEAMQQYAKPLKEGELQGDAAQEAAARLVEALAKFECPEAMITSLPNAMSKEPSSRSSFDTMVVQQLDEEVSRILAGLGGQVQKAEEGKASGADAIAAAEEAFKAATEKQLESAHTFTTAQAEQKVSEAELKAAQKSLRDLAPQMRQCTKTLEAAKDSLAKLRAGPLAAFAELRDRAPPPPEPAAAEEAEAAEGQAEAAAEAEAAPEATAEAAAEAEGAA